MHKLTLQWTKHALPFRTQDPVSGASGPQEDQRPSDDARRRLEHGPGRRRGIEQEEVREAGGEAGTAQQVRLETQISICAHPEVLYTL